MRRSPKLFEKLLDTDTKADLLIIFHNDPGLSGPPEEIAKRVGRPVAEVRRDLDDLTELGLLSKTDLYSLNAERDQELQGAISKQLTYGTVEDTENIEREYMKTDIDILDNLFTQGIPTSAAILILADPGGGTETFLSELTANVLGRGENVSYITLDNFPDNIRGAIIRAAGGSLKGELEKLKFIDCYSKSVGLESAETLAEDPNNLSGIGIAVSEVIQKWKPRVIVLDSLSTLIRKRRVQASLDFLHSLTAKTRKAETMLLVTINRKAFPLPIVAAAEEIMDGVIEIKAEEQAEGLVNYLRVTKMLGARYSTAWVPYQTKGEEPFDVFEVTKPPS